MYKLTRLSMKNWYLCQLEDVEFRGSIGMIGATGAGKSSILDAIQTVICGMNHRHWSPNASTEAKSERQIIDYCLGYLEPKADGGVPIRNETTETILALTFKEERRDGSAHHVSVGVVMTARPGESREIPVVRFIARGVDIASQEWTDGAEVKTWEEICAELHQRCELREYRAPGQFVADMLAVMRPKAAQPDAGRFLKSFFTALQFKSIKDPTDFMRDFILAPDPLDIARVREQVERWKEYKRKAEEVEAKLNALRGVRKSYETWARAYLDRVSLTATRSCAVNERVKILYGSASAIWQKADDELNEARAGEKRLKARLAGENQELGTLKALFAEKGIDGKLASIKHEGREIERDRDDLSRDVEGVSNVFRAAANLRQISFLPGSFIPSLAGAEAALSIINASPGLEWLLTGSEAVAGHAAELSKLAELPGRLEAPRQALAADLVDMRRERDTMKQNRDRLSRGEAALSNHTQALIELLKAEGISATVVCDVVDVVEQDWQRAVEMTLGLHREALIVSPAQLKRAHEILFQHRNERGLHRCRLVKTTRTHEVDHNRIAPDSLANSVRSDDPHAAAYLVQHLAGVIKAESEQDLDRLKRAIMRNGKATAALDFSVNQDRGVVLVLGRTGREESAAQLSRDLLDLQNQIGEKERESKLLDQAVQIAETVSSQTCDIPGLVFRYEEIERRGRENDARKDSVLSEEDKALQEEIDELEGHIRVRDEEVEAQQKEVQKLLVAVTRLEEKRTAARKTMRDAVGKKTQAIRALFEEDVQRLVDRLPTDETWQFRSRAEPLQMKRKFQFASAEDRGASFFMDEERKANERLRSLDSDRIARLSANARNKLLEDYCRPYSVESPITDFQQQPYWFDLAWVMKQYLYMEQHELRGYLADVENASGEMAKLIKEDLLSRLSEKFAILDRQINDLNAQLRKHRFTGGQTYSFSRKPDPAFDKIRRLATAVAENPAGAQAIIEKRTDDPLLTEAMTDLEAYLTTSGSLNLEDYRRYYTYDLVMDGSDGSMRMSMRNRSGVGSGGETQAPFYVAMAASMAMSYFPGGHPGDEPSGMGLVMFDEAFKALDVANTQALIQFFADFGLQLLVAAPEHARPAFMEVFETVVTVAKNAAARTVYIRSDFPKDKAREELALINPSSRGGLDGFRERYLEKTAAAE